VWITIETTWPNGAQSLGVPSPDSVRKTVWATLIAGARGVVFFDHRFASDFVSQNFNAMIGDAPMSAMVTALSAQLQTLAVALHGPDLGLVTAYTSSNTTAGRINDLEQPATAIRNGHADNPAEKVPT
jgi:hypothetical protein